MKIFNSTTDPLFVHAIWKTLAPGEAVVIEDAKKAEAMLRTGVLKAVEEVKAVVADVRQDEPESAPEPKPEPAPESAQRTEQVQGSQLVETETAPATEKR